MNRRRIVIGGLAVLAVLVSVAAAQQVFEDERAVRFEGRVAWIDAQHLILAVDNDLALNVDLRRIPQSETRMISQNDYVIVIGHVLRPTRRIVAISVRRGTPWFPTAPE